MACSQAHDGQWPRGESETITNGPRAARWVGHVWAARSSTPRSAVPDLPSEPYRIYLPSHAGVSSEPKPDLSSEP